MIIFAAIQIPVMLAVAFFFATMFDLGVAKYGSLFRTIFFIPFAVPAVVGAVMWSFLLEPQFGPFVHLAHALGFANTDFFSSNLILPSIIVIVIWEWTGYNMIILYAALRTREATVNSFHHQAVAELGEGLRATATAPDGVAEAIELVGYPALGVQFELQEEWKIDRRFKGVFDWFVAAAAAQLRGRRLSVS